MTTLDLFKFVSIIDNNNNENLCFKAVHLNMLHRNLLKHSIRCDFSKSSLCRIEHEHPTYVTVNPTEIRLRKISHITSKLYTSIDIHTIQIVKKQWEIIIKEF